MDSLVSKVNQIIKQRSLLRKGDKVLVAFSGGPDSTCLLSVLGDIQKLYELDIAAAHVNYGLRLGSAGDEKFVRQFSKSMNIRLHVLKAKPKISGSGTNFEDEARDIRYEFFRRIAKQHGMTKIALAHNANDQAETVIMRFLRGSSLKGLGGMRHQRGAIVRPMLDVTRKNILRYLKQHDIKYRTDETNLDTKFTRNRIRLNLIPLLKRDYNPGLTSTLIKNAALYQQSWDIIKEIAEHHIDNAIVNQKKGQLSIRWPDKLAAPRLIKAVMITGIIERVGGSVKNIGFDLLSDAVKHIDNPQRNENFKEISSLTIVKNNGIVNFKLSR